jgi:hypothetical protein
MAEGTPGFRHTNKELARQPQGYAAKLFLKIRRGSLYVTRRSGPTPGSPNKLPLAIRTCIGKLLRTHGAEGALIGADVTPIVLGNDSLTTLTVIAHLQGHGDTAFRYETSKTFYQFLRFRLGRRRGG